MEKIASFTVDHENLLSGLYVSRKDTHDGVTVTTFDLRLTAPNREAPLGTGVMHTIEHIGATYLRSSGSGKDVVYFGPMGCRTGFYLLMFGDLRSADVLPLVRSAFGFIAEYEGDIPGASPSECGNWSDQDLDGAKVAAARYLSDLAEPRMEYPGSVK